MAKYYPVMLNLEHRPCLVVGGGRVAERKVKSLLEAKADITVVSPQFTSALFELARNDRIKLLQNDYRSDLIKSFAFVCAASDDMSVNEEVAKECHSNGILINVVDNEKLSSVIMPAVLCYGGVVISVSTSAHSPMLASKIRDKIADIIGPEYGEYNELLGKTRRIIIQKVADPEKRRQIFKDIQDDKYLAMIKNGEYITPEIILRDVFYEL